MVLSKVNSNMIQRGVLRGLSTTYRTGDAHFVCHASKVRILRKKSDLTPSRPAGPPAQLTKDVLEDLREEVAGSEMSIYPEKQALKNRPRRPQEPPRIGVPLPDRGPGPLPAKHE